MKKFLLVLSCCLATWCSVLAGPKSSPEISLMQASAPAAAPVPGYPAKINSAYHDPDRHVIVVNCDQYHSGSLVFLRELGSSRPEIYRNDNSSTGTGKRVEIPLEPEWEKADYFTILISAGSGINICGGMGVKIIHKEASVKVNEVSYDLKNKVVTVKYSINNPNKQKIIINVTDNINGTGKQYYAPIGSTSYQLPSSIFRENVGYYIKVSCEKASDGKNFTFDTARSGYMAGVSFGYSHAEFKYNLKNAYDPYIYIKKGSQNGPVVKKIQITNTNGDYKTATLYDFRYALSENVNYVAGLYDGTEDLRIYSNTFKIPNKEIEEIKEIQFSWKFNRNTNKVAIWCTSSPSPKVTIELYRYKGGTIQDHKPNVGINESVDMGVAYPGEYYIITVRSGSISKSQTVLF